MEEQIICINIGDKRIRNIKVKENNEPLIDLLNDNKILVDTSKKHIFKENTYYSYIRKGVYLKLGVKNGSYPKQNRNLANDNARKMEGG
jgi:hypothetical protein